RREDEFGNGRGADRIAIPIEPAARKLEAPGSVGRHQRSILVGDKVVDVFGVPIASQNRPRARRAGRRGERLDAVELQRLEDVEHRIAASLTGMRAAYPAIVT